MIYMDNAATTYPKPEEVYSFADSFYRENGVYQSRGNYKASKKVNSLIGSTREKLLELFCAPINHSVAFTHSATIALNTILNGLDYHNGLNIYITHFEHNSVLRTLNHIKQKININIFKILVNKIDLLYNIGKIKEQFDRNPPNVVIINHASNVFGNIVPAKQIFDLAKKYGATTILDCSQTAGLIKLDLSKCKSDFTVFAGHKTLYAPFGIAGFIMNTNYKINPLIYGGTGFESANINMPLTYPERLEAGSLDIYAIAGLYASLIWIKNIGIDYIYNKEKDLYNYAIDHLNNINHIKLFNVPRKTVNIISFISKEYTPGEISKILDSNDIATRSGLHCSPDSHKFIGTFPSGTTRVGLGYFNKKDEINKLINLLNSL